MNEPIMIYLAGPIDDVELDVASGWREQAGKDAPAGVLFYSPLHAFVDSCGPATIIKAEQVNRTILQAAEATIANLTGDGRAFGTIREIEFARLHRRVVAVIVDEPLKSLLAYDIHQVSTFEEGLQVVLEEVVKTRNTPQSILGFPFLMQPPTEEEQ